MINTQESRGAIHFVGIFLLLLIGLGIYMLASWTHEVHVLRDQVDGLNQRLVILEAHVQNLNH